MVDCDGYDVVKIFVHIHVFYAELVPELRNCLSNIESVCSAGTVISTLTYPVCCPDLRSKLERSFPNSHILCLPNIGYDIGPFFEAIHEIDLDEFDFVVKLHSKRDVTRAWVNFRPLVGDSWRKLLTFFCRTPKAFSQILRAFNKQPKLGMVAHHRLIDPSGVGSGHHPEWAENLLKRIGLKPCGRTMVYGTMFVCRAKLMKPFQKLRLSDCDELDQHERHHITGLASSAEGAFGMAIQAQGYRVSEGCLPASLSVCYYAILHGLYKCLRGLSSLIRSKKGV